MAVPRVIGLDFSIPAHILGSCDGYRLMVCGDADATAHRPVPGDLTVAITPAHPLSAVGEADIVVVPGFDRPEVPLPPAYLDAIRVSADHGARIVGICTGTFALAASGVLDGRAATTHWQYLSLLRERYPRVNVVENTLFVEEGKILTSAGAGAGIDACLYLISSDYGSAAAYEAGKGVVAAPARSGDHRQYVDVLTPPRSDLSRTRAWVMENLGEPITVQQMAAHSNLSRRTFIRHFVTETGLPPMRWVVLQRILSARRLLETSDWPMDRIAAATGFGSGANLRSVFRREVGTTPNAYRRSVPTEAMSTNRTGS
ncbi:GlxA family transcriptional regulator [Kribbella turkmenica]|nr:helix-turn-helix domain-containing protein [Kribbella turkmenica]